MSLARIERLILGVLFGFAMLTFLAVQAAEQNALSLEQSQDFAVNQNRDIRKASLEVEKTTASLKSIMASRYPSITTLTFWGQQLNTPNYQNFAALPGVFQPVTQQYRLDLQVRQARLGVEIARQQLRLTRQRVVADVKKAYLSLVALKSAIDSRSHNVAFLRELSQFVAAEVSRGAALPVDLSLVQAKYARADFDYERDQDDFITAGQTLNRFLARPLATPIDVSLNAMPTVAEESKLDPRATISVALTQRPELAQAKATVKQFRLQDKIEMSRYIPDVSVGATGIFSKHLDITLPRQLVAVGALAVWEPWDWGRRLQLGKVADRQMKQSQVALNDLTDVVAIDADNARRALKVAYKGMQAGALEESSAAEELRVIYRRYQTGSSLLKDVMEAQAAYSKAISENVKAKADYTRAEVELDRALGTDF